MGAKPPKLAQVSGERVVPGVLDFIGPIISPRPQPAANLGIFASHARSATQEPG
jgi:hypothetical protein